MMAKLANFLWVLEVFFIFNICRSIFPLANSVDSRSTLFHIKPDYYKQGNPTRVLHVTDEYQCQIQCLRERQCSSVNFKRSKGDHFLHRCKLFNTNAKEDVLSGKRVDYYESIVDGGWSEWGSWKWNNCSLPSTCVPTRKRSCTSPSPLNSGLLCSGPSRETKECPVVADINITECASAMGMESRAIKDNQITSSSFLKTQNNTRNSAKNGRLNKKYDNHGIGGWAAGSRETGEYIQVDLGSINVITMVATQGRYCCHNHWVTKYLLSYSDDGTNWKHYQGDCVKVFPGNTDKNTIVTNKLEIPMRARYIRLIVKEYRGWPTMRMELYGCTNLS